MHEQMIVGEAVPGRSTEVRKQLLRMASNMSISNFDMAALLAEAQENGYATQWGFASLLDYGARELGLKKRKTQYLARIGKVTKAVGLTREQYEPAGVSKLREIVTLDPEGSFFDKETRVSEPLDEHIVRLILGADEMTVQQIRDEVLRLQGRTGPDSPVTRSYTVPRSAYEHVIKPAFELIRRRLGSQGRDADGLAIDYKDGVVLEMMCAEVLGDIHNQPEDVTIELPMEEL